MRTLSFSTSYHYTFVYTLRTIHYCPLHSDIELRVDAYTGTLAVIDPQRTLSNKLPVQSDSREPGQSVISELLSDELVIAMKTNSKDYRCYKISH